MKTNADLFREFSEMGSRVAFSLRNGFYMEGYILGISEGKFEFAFGGPMAPEESKWFDIGHVDFESLSFFCEVKRQYMEARWNNDTNSWEVLPSSGVQ